MLIRKKEELREWSGKGYNYSDGEINFELGYAHSFVVYDDRTYVVVELPNGTIIEARIDYIKFID